LPQLFGRAAGRADDEAGARWLLCAAACGLQRAAARWCGGQAGHERRRMRGSRHLWDQACPRSRTRPRWSRRAPR